jgi:hypothetical protein
MTASQTLISQALQGEISAEQWMVDSREKSAREAEDYGTIAYCEDHLSLARENYQEAARLKTLLLHPNK